MTKPLRDVYISHGKNRDRKQDDFHELKFVTKM